MEKREARYFCSLIDETRSNERKKLRGEVSSQFVIQPNTYAQNRLPAWQYLATIIGQRAGKRGYQRPGVLVAGGAGRPVAKVIVQRLDAAVVQSDKNDGRGPLDVRLIAGGGL